MIYRILIRMGHLLDWWWAGLVAWLPDTLHLTRHQVTIRYRLDNDDNLSLERRNNRKNLAQQQLLASGLEADDSALLPWQKQHHDISARLLTIDDSQVLSTSFLLPAAARENLAEVIAFEIDRQTPFDAELVYWHYCLSDTQQANDKIMVLLSVVTKSYVDQQISRLAEWSLPVTGLCLQSGVENKVIHLAQADKANTNRIWINSFFSVLAISLLFVWLYQPVWHFDTLQQKIAPELATAKQQAQQVQRLAKENAVMREQLSSMIAKRVAYLSRTGLLAELSTLLPEHTWLERSSFSPDKLVLKGESSEASDLIAMLLKTGHFKDVRFSAPTRPNRQTGKDRFQIEALLREEAVSNDS